MTTADNIVADDENYVLSEIDVQVYRDLLDHRSVDERDPAVQTSVAKLTRLHLLTPNPHQENALPVPLPPEHAERALMERERERVAEAARRMEATAALRSALSPLYERARLSSDGGGVETLRGVEAINIRIRSAAEQATAELFTAQPGERPPEILDKSLDVDAAILRRGISLHTIYSASARTRAPEIHWATEMSKLGAQIRTLPDAFNRIILIDKKHAFIDDPSAEGSVHAALHVTHPGMVAYLAAQFDLAWRRADIWTGGRAPLTQRDQLTGVQMTILRSMAEGLQDQQIAREIACSRRTMSEHLKRLYELFGVESKFQLGQRWAEISSNLPE
ncbi:LuxR C-terminal-related transcriptional regulator [Streptomyces sp. NPDC054838]